MTPKARAPDAVQASRAELGNAHASEQPDHSEGRSRVKGRHGDDFTRNRFAWLDQVRDDRELNPSAFKLAYVIGGYVNRTKGYAWPSIAELAERHGSTERTILTCLHSLQTRGHLSIDSGRGRHRVSQYRPILVGKENVKPASPFETENMKPASPFPDSAKVKNTAQKNEIQRGKTRRILHTELFEEQIEETPESIEADLFNSARRDRLKGKRSKLKRKTTVPTDWPSLPEITWAMAYWLEHGNPDLANSVELEARKARDHHLAKNTQFFDWTAAWRSWCHNALKFASTRQGTRLGSKSTIDAAVRYAQRHGLPEGSDE